MHKIRVLIFNNSPPSHIGGNESSFHRLCNKLHNLGIEVFALFPLRTEKLDLPSDIEYQVLTFKSETWVANYTLSVMKIFDIIKKVNPDIIHLNDGLSPTDAMIILINKIFLGKPIFVDIQSFYRNPLYNFAVLLHLPIYNFVTSISVNNPLIKEMVKKVLLNKSKISKDYYTFFDAPQIVENNTKKDSSEFRFLFVGILDREHEYKGLDLLLLAIEYLNKLDKKYINSIALEIVGGGNLLDHFSNYAKKHELHNVTFHGRVDSLEEIFKTSDALILPSKKRGEGFGKVVLEALAHGLPVIVSKYAGTYFIPKEYGVGDTVDPYNEEKFAKQLLVFADKCRHNLFSYQITKFQQVIYKESKTILENLIKNYKRSIKLTEQEYRITDE